MTLQLDKSQLAIQKSVLEFAKGEFDSPTFREFDKNGKFPTEIWQKAAELGFIGIHLPEKYSGGGLSWLENIIVAETFASKDSTAGSAVMLSSVAAEWLAQFGSDAQKERLLPEILEGRTLSAGIITAPVLNDQQNDASMEETGTDGAWRIQGTIDNVVNAGNAGVIMMLCHDKATSDEKDGFSMVIAETGDATISIEKTHDMLGFRMTGMGRIKFDNHDIPPSNIIGKPGKGQSQFQQVNASVRMLLAGLSLGTAQGAFERAVAYVKGREQFRRKLAVFQITRQKLAHMAIQIEQARALLYRAATQMNPKKPDMSATSMASMAATRAGVDVTYEVIQLFGGYGYTTEYDVERFYRDAKTLQLLSGYGNDLIEDVAAAIIGRIK